MVIVTWCNEDERLTKDTYFNSVMFYSNLLVNFFVKVSVTVWKGEKYGWWVLILLLYFYTSFRSCFTKTRKRSKTYELIHISWSRMTFSIKLEKGHLTSMRLSKRWKSNSSSIFCCIIRKIRLCFVVGVLYVKSCLF